MGSQEARNVTTTRLINQLTKITNVPDNPMGQPRNAEVSLRTKTARHNHVKNTHKLTSQAHPEQIKNDCTLRKIDTSRYY